MNQIRIIAGKWRGRKLATLNLAELKPTSDRVRETLFNWLMFNITDTHCLDAFAGSGALGLEALSRGASHVNFCETNTKLAEQLKTTISKLDCKSETGVLLSNFLKTNFSKKFDLIFLDPPFHKDLVPACLEKAKTLLKPEGLVYLETESDFQLKTDYEILKSKQAGKVNFYLLKN